MTGLGDPRTSSLDPTTGNLYVAQADDNIAQIVIVRGKPWKTPITPGAMIPTGQPTTQPSFKPSLGSYRPHLYTIPLPTSKPSSQPTGHPTMHNRRQIFSYTNGMQGFVVPAGVTSIGFTVVGASGGYDNGPYGNGMSNGGYGGVATGTLTVTPGSTLYVVVGGQGLSSSGPRSPPSTIAGGYNGGGASGCSTCTSDGGSGGGATDIRTSPDDITTRLVVAGGGGGADGDAHKSWPGGNGGGLVGASVPGEVTYGVATDAYGGSQTSGGVASSCGATPLNTAGTLGNGGTSPAGGGGGGGYYGGGGGCSSGGAGGSGYCDAMLCTSVAYSVASSFGAGSVTLT